MDQIKIGKFIQSLRKELKLTQKDLADKLNVSDKTISKWETGNGMPDLVFLKPLSDILGISINELLSGETIDNNNFKDKTEENIVNTINYSNDEIKKNKIHTIIISFGICLLAFSLLFFTSNGLKAWISIFSLIIISIGIYKIRSKYKVITPILFLICSIGVLLLMDYNNVNNEKEPIFAYLIETNSSGITYKTPFYNVYRCNPDTANEYYEIDFSRNKSICTSPFDPNVSDISRLLKYKNKYLGNNSNTINLYYSLPLSKYGFTTELDSTNLGIIINYNNSEFYINEDSDDNLFVKKSILYNAISTFVLIDNVEYIIYNFSGTSYKFNKNDMIESYDDYAKIFNKNDIDENNFRKYVNEKILDNDFVEKTFEKLIEKQ